MNSAKMTSDLNYRIFSPLMTDLYQVTMAYAYWRSDSKDKTAVFDLYFRKNPFNGEYTVFAGLSDCIKFIENFHYTEDDINYLKSILPDTVDKEFYVYLRNMNTKNIALSSVPEGTIVFPRVPLLTLEGPLPIIQLLETPLLTYVNFASLVTTNATRYKIAAGSHKKLLEFGLRRAQGPDGGLSASRYCYIGGSDATSNLLAGKVYGIPVQGTHSHSFVSSFILISDLRDKSILNRATGRIEPDFVSICMEWRGKICSTSIFPNLVDDGTSQINEGELTAFAAYALAFPDHFLALIDTYDVMKSGLPNFCAVSLALDQMGYRAVGIRIDSGDLAYLSNQCRHVFRLVATEYSLPWFAHLTIVASNDINEQTLYSLNEQGNEIDCYGIGTHLVTCHRQPALGCVYKVDSAHLCPDKVKCQPRNGLSDNHLPQLSEAALSLAQDSFITPPHSPKCYKYSPSPPKSTLDSLQDHHQQLITQLVEINGNARMKLTQDVEKMTIPGKKNVYRLFGKDDKAILDLIRLNDEPQPIDAGSKILCRHPFTATLRTFVNPSRVEPLLKLYWKDGKLQIPLPSIHETRKFVQENLARLRQDHKRHLNPTPYKVSVTDAMFAFIHKFWDENAPISELS